MYAMPPHMIEELPNEVFEAISASLDLRDLNNVRLVSRSMASKVTQNHYASFLRCKRVLVARDALELTAELTANEGIGCFVEELMLVGVVYNAAGLDHQLAKGTATMVGRGSEANGLLELPKEAGTPIELEHAARESQILQAKQADYHRMHGDGEDVALLTRIFRNLAANTKRRGLKCISTDVVEYRKDSKTPQHASQRLAWRSVWHMAAETFHTLMLALAAASLPVDELNIFCNDYSGHCSLACNEVSGCDWQAKGTALALANVQSLSISISDRILDETEHDISATGDPVERLTASASVTGLLPNLDALRSQSTEDVNFNGLVALLQLCTSMKRLDLRRCRLRRQQHELDDDRDQRFFQDVARAVHLPALQALALHNFKVREKDLLSILESQNVNNLMLHNILLDPGDRWDPIFTYCTSTHHGINALHFEDLYQDNAQIFFGERPEEIANSVIPGLHKYQNIHRQQDRNMMPIIWSIPRYRKLRMDRFVKQRHDRHRDMFGPPVSHFPH
ncbi:hypothetical protein CBER1_09419 [Cercospora berteroae]|uniref:F-box domain-containing protein n=1 Tax=Cercospora berteroae TaxID=357750 RepID=A0A2S6CDY7_9PEZI|nr:hypothetical protein CBER1_09419 [Cercospora berteroae]